VILGYDSGSYVDFFPLGCNSVQQTELICGQRSVTASCSSLAWLEVFSLLIWSKKIISSVSTICGKAYPFDFRAKKHRNYCPQIDPEIYLCILGFFIFNYE
jgi:hypothetical protein